jgi:uncharacterized protein (TIGR02996 family)
MTDDAFLADIIANPDDDSLRLIYADWLEDRGEPERATFIRVQCELARDGLRPDTRRADLEAKERELLAGHEEEWAGLNLPHLDRERVTGLEYRRGFLWGVSVEGPAGLAQVEGLFLRNPLQHPRVFVTPENVSVLAAWPCLARLTSLSLASCDLRAGDIRWLATSPHLASLTALDLYQNSTGSWGLRDLADSPHLPRLRELVLGWNFITSAGVRALASSPLLGHLTHLDLFYNRVGTPGAVALAGSPHAASLAYLNLRGNNVGNEGGEALAASPYLENLAFLDLHENRVTEPGREVLRARFGDRVRF